MTPDVVVDPTTEPVTETVEAESDSAEAPPWEWEALGDTAQVTSLNPPEETIDSEGDGDDATLDATETDVVPPASTTIESATPEVEEFVVELPPEEKAALLAQTQKDLDTATNLLAAWRGRDDVGAETLERLQTVEGFLTQARAALEIEDVEAAAGLALKARLLAEEIGAP